MHRLGAGWIVGDDPQRADGYAGLSGETAGKLSHLLDVRLHALLADLLEFGHVAILVLANHVQPSDDEFPYGDRVAVIVGERVRVGAQKQPLRRRVEFGADFAA